MFVTGVQWWRDSTYAAYRIAVISRNPEGRGGSLAEGLSAYCKGCDALNSASTEWRGEYRLQILAETLAKSWSSVERLAGAYILWAGEKTPFAVGSTIQELDTVARERAFHVLDERRRVSERARESFEELEKALENPSDNSDPSSVREA